MHARAVSVADEAADAGGHLSHRCDRREDKARKRDDGGKAARGAIVALVADEGELPSPRRQGARQLGTRRDLSVDTLLPPVDYPVGIVAGNRSIYPITSVFLPKPHDGRVSVENTKLDGMADHIIVRASHPWLMRNEVAIAQTIAFLREGKFATGS